MRNPEHNSLHEDRPVARAVFRLLVYTVAFSGLLLLRAQIFDTLRLADASFYEAFPSVSLSELGGEK